MYPRKLNLTLFPSCPLKKVQGFTLIETIVGMVTLAIAFSVISTFLFPAANQSARQVHQIKATELGQSFLNEIMGRAFDENSDMSGGFFRCGENQNGALINCSAVLGTDTNDIGDDGYVSRTGFDDVDDYITNGLTGVDLVNSIGEDIGTERYLGYSVSITVCNASNYNGCDNNENNYTAKLVTITVTTPQIDIIEFSAYKGNY